MQHVRTLQGLTVKPAGKTPLIFSLLTGCRLPTQVAANQSATSVSQRTELLDASVKPAIKAASDAKTMVWPATPPSVKLVQVISHSGSKEPKIVLVHAVLDSTRAQKVIVVLATRRA